jgi:heterodisulfide reductase subunit C
MASCSSSSLPRYLAQRFIDSGALVEKQVLAQSSNESVWVGWRCAR